MIASNHLTDGEWEYYKPVRYGQLNNSAKNKVELEVILAVYIHKPEKLRAALNNHIDGKVQEAYKRGYIAGALEERK